jgi:hypothetical protein
MKNGPFGGKRQSSKTSNRKHKELHIGVAMNPRQITPTYVWIFLALLLGTFSLVADSWKRAEIREFPSPSGSHILKVEPKTSGSWEPGHCLGTLFKVSDGRRQQVWSRQLINDGSPYNAFVSDSGNYVVTMDEWGQIGKLPVVIYGSRGDLIQVHSRESLGLTGKDIGMDIIKIEMSTSGFWWSKDSISFFDPKEEKFLIRLHWGKWLVFDLRSGELFPRESRFSGADAKQTHAGEWQRLDEFKTKTITPRAIALLKFPEPEKQKTGALICGQEKIREAIPLLKGFLTSPASYLTGSGKQKIRVYFVHKAAKEALEQMGENVTGVIIEEAE